MVMGINWGAIGIVGVILFLIGWYFIGILAAVIIVLIVVVLMSILRISWKRPNPKQK
jgi:hypothetical protein